MVLQKRAIRIISNASFDAHTEPLFLKNNILKIKDLYLHSIACYAYKNQFILDNFRSTHTYETRNRNFLVPPFERLRSTEQSVIYNIIILWDDIPLSIRQSNTFPSFKCTYKKYLLSRYEH